MKIDVVIPTHNRAQVLERAIQSVLQQSYPIGQLVIVDDGSTDETQQVLEKFREHPQVLLLAQPNKGVSAARNLGVRSSLSEWISFLDSDDEWLPEKLELQVQALKKNPELRFLHAEEIWIRKGVRVNPKVKHRKSGPDLFERSLEFCLISPSTVLMRRDLFDQHGGFDESMTVCEDFDLWNRILASEEVGFIEDFVTKKYGGHEDQLSMKFVAMDYWRIRSLVELSALAGLSMEKRELILEQLRRKVPLLLRGYLKHQNLERHEEIQRLVSHLPILTST